VAKTRHVGADFVDALPTDGERRLMLAVLIDAIRTLSIPQQPDSHPHLYRAWLKELAWVQSNDHNYTFSFVNICGALGFDADYVRRYVLSLPVAQRPVRICRYAAKVGESWQRQRQPVNSGLRVVRDGERPPQREVTAVATSTVAMVDTAERLCAVGSL
jgi:hypothetical protein